MFHVGEFWSSDVKEMLEYLDFMESRYSLFDSPLLHNFSRLSTTEKSDLRTVFDGSLVQVRPGQTVTVVVTHNTKPGQTAAPPVEGVFKALAYALILLRAQGYPGVFCGDIYGIKGDDRASEPPAYGGQLADIVLARKLYAYDGQDDYWDDTNYIGFVRRGTAHHPAGLVCVMSNAGSGKIKMNIGGIHRGEVWTDMLQ